MVGCECGDVAVKEITELTSFALTKHSLCCFRF